MEAVEEPSLSNSTLSILKEFLVERKQAEDRAAEDPFAENWGMSQFWYTDDTAEVVAAEVVRAARQNSIACVACPSLFRVLQRRYPKQSAHLFEYDKRFKVLGNFAFYDYNQPLDIPVELHHIFKVVVIDPPYLSQGCLEKVAQSVQLLAVATEPAIFALTGASMQRVVEKLLHIRPVKWRPEHKNKLGNDFCFYTSDPSVAARLNGWEDSGFESGA